MLDEYTDEFGTNLESQIPEFNGQPLGYTVPEQQARPYAPPQPQPAQQPQPVYQQPIQPQPAPIYVQTPPTPQPPPAPPAPPISQNQFFYPQQQPVYQQPAQPAPPMPVAPAARINSVFDEESRELNDIMKAEQNAGCLKNLLFVVICAVVVLGSFWLSYLVGAQFLLPNKTSSFSVTKGINKLKRLKNTLMNSQDIVKDEKAFTSYTKPPAPQTIVPPEIQYTPVAPPRPIETPPSRPAAKPPAKPSQPAAATVGTMYRVVVGSFDTKQEAQDVAENIRADGFPVYMYTADGKHRLQIGAFKSKALATSLMTKATEYGYNAFISIK